jgi:hypothetical protein
LEEKQGEDQGATREVSPEESIEDRLWEARETRYCMEREEEG